MDYFTVFTTGGIVLWQKCYQPVSSALLDSLIADIFIEDKRKGANTAGSNSMNKDRYTVKWTTANEFDIIIVAVYQSLLQITFIDELLASVKKLFTTLYGAELKVKDPEKLPVCKFDDYFSIRYAELEKQSVDQGASKAFVDTSGSVDTSDDQDIQDEDGQDEIEDKEMEVNGNVKLDKKSKAAAKLASLQAKRDGGRRKPAAKSADNVKRLSKKKGRKWGADGTAYEASDDENPTLDFSSGTKSEPVASDDGRAGTSSAIFGNEDVSKWGTKTKSGDFVLRELSNEINSILATPEPDAVKSESVASAALASGFGFFRNIIGSKVIEEKDMNAALAGMKEHLMKKNIAPEVAQHLCDVVSKSLVGTKTGSWTSVEKTVRDAMEDALRKILTPSTSVDLLHEIQKVKSTKPARPYVISVVGVNGVGKSTNLSKIAFWLLQNDMKLLIAACDTFRSGAVEQLRVHARNLKALTEREGGTIELFEKGYGKDAAVIARDAINYGREKGYDVVLIDTAGRRHNDTRLMSSLEKFAKYANPDKIVMVGEALVGTDSVQQARNFNAAFGSSRNLDFFLISKCDTVGDMIGSMVNMTYSTGIPVLFVGTGQMYTDLRTLSVPWAVNMLMS
ncbi:SRP54-type protein [Lipomyces oligophaga]|uniref:SRP54-type protein n=1 Tax=Lipomyces oligophaga TaxID=45792 RepID=UPI0034CD17C7